MKHFVLLHNIIMMAHANIMNSHEPWFEVELVGVRTQLTIMVMGFKENDKITDYQETKLLALIHGITAPAE